MRFHLSTLLIVIALWLSVSVALAMVSAGFRAGFRDGFLGEMNKDIDALETVFRSPVLKWLSVIAAIYLLAFFPLMWLNARGVIGMKTFVRLYMPIRLAMGAALLAFDWLRARWSQPEDDESI